MAHVVARDVGGALETAGGDEVHLQDGRETAGGFTLVELLVIVVIIGILAALSIPLFFEQRVKAFDATAAQDVRTMVTAQEVHHTEFGSYASSFDLLEVQGFRRSDPDQMEHAVCARDDGDGFVVGARHKGSPHAWLVDSPLGTAPRRFTVGSGGGLADAWPASCDANLP